MARQGAQWKARWTSILLTCMMTALALVPVQIGAQEDPGCADGEIFNETSGQCEPEGGDDPGGESCDDDSVDNNEDGTVDESGEPCEDHGPMDSDLSLFGGVLNVTVTIDGTAVGNESADVFVQQHWDDSSQSGGCERFPEEDGSTKTLGNCNADVVNATGTATLSGLEPGTYDLDVFHFESDTFHFVENAFTVPEGASADGITEVSPLTIDLPEGAWVYGTVHNATGSPVDGADVEVFGDMIWGHGSTNATGEFNVTVSGEGTVGIHIRAPPELGLRSYSPPCDPFQPDNEFGTCFELTAGNGTGIDGNTTDGDIDPIVLRGGSSITGTLVDSDENGLGPGFAQAFKECDFGGEGGHKSHDDCEFDFLEGPIGEDGTFTLTGASAGKYTIEAIWDSSSGERRVSKHGVDVSGEGSTDAGLFKVGGGVTVAGSITGPSGVPFAFIHAFEGRIEPGGHPGFPIAFGESNETGNYSLFDVPLPSGDDKNITIEVEPPSGTTYTRARVVFDLAPYSEGETAQLDIALEVGTVLRGFVTDSDGAPVSSADVGVFPLGPCDSFCGNGGFTDSNGEFSVSVEAGTYGMFIGPPPESDLGVKVIDDFSEEGPIVVPEDVDDVWQNVTLSGGGKISGTVTTSDDQPLPNEVWVFAFGPSGHGFADVRSDGSFEMRGMSPGKYTVMAEVGFGGSYAPAEARGVVVAEEGTTTQDLVLTKGSCVSATVTDGNSDPVQGAFFGAHEFVPPGSDSFGKFTFDISDASGQIEACGLTVSEHGWGYHLDPPFGSSDLAGQGGDLLDPGEDPESLDPLSITLSGAVRVTGSVVDGDGDPVRFGFVGLFNPESETGSGGPIEFDGSFDFGVPEGTGYCLEVWPDPWDNPDLGSYRECDVDIGSGGKDFGTITLGQGGSLTGRVINADGDGVAGVFVDVDFAGALFTGASDPEGYFRVAGISASEGSSVEVRFFPPVSSDAIPTAQDITWSPDENGTHALGNVNLTTGAEVVVTVEREDGDGGTTRLASGGDVEIWPNGTLTGDGANFHGRRAAIDSNGNATFDGVPDGSYHVRVFPDSGAGGMFRNNFTVNGTDVTTTVVLGQATTLQVNVSNSTQALEGATVEVFNSSTNSGAFGTTNATGNVTLNLPPGTYNVRVSADDHNASFEQGVVVSAGSNSHDVTLEEADLNSGQAFVCAGTYHPNGTCDPLDGWQNLTLTGISVNADNPFEVYYHTLSSEGGTPGALVAPSADRQKMPLGTYEQSIVYEGEVYSCGTRAVQDPGGWAFIAGLAGTRSDSCGVEL